MYYNIAPEIFRKRLIIEGRYTAKIANPDFLRDFLLLFTKQIHDPDHLIRGLRGPFVSNYNYSREVKPDSSYDGLIIWNENEVSAYVWHDQKFFTVDIYTCSDFDTDTIIDFVLKQFSCTEFTWHELPQPSPFLENKDVEVRVESEIGTGLFAKEPILRESYISYIDGEVFYAESESQLANTRRGSVNHVVPFHRKFYRNAFNNLAVNINHSCDPNCYFKDLFCLTAMRDIAAGEELTVSYSLFCNSDWKVPGGKCLCGSKNCFGSILPWRELPAEYKKKYLSYTSDWILFEEMKKLGFVEKLGETF